MGSPRKAYKHAYYIKNRKRILALQKDHYAKPSVRTRKTAYDKAYRDGLKDELRDKFLKRAYGITLEEKMRLSSEQKNQCRICQKSFENPKDMHVDHSHETKKVRGILCGKCNCGLGMFNDSPALLDKAKAYLQADAVNASDQQSR